MRQRRFLLATKRHCGNRSEAHIKIRLRPFDVRNPGHRQLGHCGFQGRHVRHANKNQVRLAAKVISGRGNSERRVIRLD